MAYTITAANRSPIVVASGATDNTTSISLIGKNVPNYGQTIAQNLVSMMQNFAGNSEPNGPLDGQLWYDTNLRALKVYDNGTPKVIASINTGAATPAGNLIGDLWWNTNEQTLNVYNGGAWVSIGPPVINTGAGVIAETILDNGNVARDLLKVNVGSTLVMIFSKVAFVPKTNLPGFPSINAGITLCSDVLIPGNKLAGNVTAATVTTGTMTAANVFATTIGNSSTAFSGASGAIAGTLTSSALYATTIGNASTTLTGSTVSVTGVSAATVAATTVSATTVSATTVTATTLTGTLSTAAQTNVTSLGTLSGLTVGGAILPSSNATINIGSVGATFNTVFAKATSAQYADLAERYHSDEIYPAGTVVKIGGSEEITICDEDASTEVFGVISKNPAYLMNDNQSDPHWLPVVLVGRSIVNVIGTCNKGQYLVSDAAGHARAAKEDEVVFNKVIGRALVNKTTFGSEQIECFINTN